MRHGNKRRASKSSISTTVPQIENLEQRLLLTTLTGGDTFQYTDVDGQLIHVSVSGDAIIELIGASADGSTLTLGDLPGQFVASERGLSGTAYLLDGCDVIGVTDITDPDYGAGSSTPSNNVPADHSTEINLQGLASEGALFGSQTYAFNVATVGEGEDASQLVQLVQLGNDDGAATVRAMLQQATLGIDVAAALTPALTARPNAMAVDPNDPLTLYTVHEDPTVGTVGASVLSSVNSATGQVTTLGILRDAGAAVNLYGVKAIGFDDAGQLWAMTQDYDGDPDADATGDPDPNNLDGAMVRIDKTDGTFTTAADVHRTLEDGNQANYDYEGLTFDADSGTWRAVARVVEDGGAVSSYLHTITAVGGSGLATITTPTQITVGDGATAIAGLAYTTNAEGETILVGLDNSPTDPDNGRILPRLVVIADDGAASILSENGKTVQGQFFDLVNVNGVLYTADTDNLYRGSAVSLGVDNETGITTVVSIEAADFRPITGDAEDGLLYFMVLSGDEDTAVRDLYTIDANATNRSAMQSSLRRVGRFTGLAGENANVNSMTWDQTGATDARLLFSVVTQVDNTDQGQIRSWTGTVNRDGNGQNPRLAVTTVATLTYRAGPITTITGIEVGDDDRTDEDTFIFATINDGGTDILAQINLGSGVVSALGDTTNFGDGAPVAGADLEGLTWNETLTNPFTGEIGALLATDVSSDELVVLDTRFRAADQLMTVYVSQASADSSVSISAYHVTQQGAWLTPYTGVSQLANGGNTRIATTDTRFDLRVTHATTGANTIINFQEGVGGVYIGARQFVKRNDQASETEPLVPLITGNLAGQLGVYASDLLTAPIQGIENVGAGIMVAPSLLEYFNGSEDLADRLMGGNLDNVVSLAVRRDITEDAGIVVFDNDNVNSLGQRSGAEMAYLDPDTGYVTYVREVVNASNGTPVYRVNAAGYGDIDLTGNELLYAIAQVANPAPTDLVDSLGADFSFDAVTSVATGDLFAVNDNAGTLELVRVSRAADGGVDSATALGRIVVADAASATGVSDVAAVYAMDVDPSTGQVYLLADNANGNVALFIVGVTAVDADGDTVAAEVFATEIGEVDQPGDAYVDIAFDNEGNLFALRTPAPGSTRLVTINKLTAATANVGATNIQISAAEVDIIAFDVDDEGNFLGIDTSGGAGNHRVVFINRFAPAASRSYTAAGSVPDDRLGYTSDGAGNFYSIQQNGGGNDDLYVSPGYSTQLGQIAAAGSPAPVDRSAENIGGDLGVDLGGAGDFQALTSDRFGNVYGIVDNGGVMELFLVTLTADQQIDTVTTVGRVVIPDSDPNSTGYRDAVAVHAMDFNPVDGLLYIIADDEDGQATLFRLATVATDTDGDFLAEELATTEIGSVDGGTPFIDMAFADSGLLYGVTDPGGNAAELVRATLSADFSSVVTVDALGRVQIAAVDQDVEAIDFSADGSLLGVVDRDLGTNDSRIIEIDTTDPADSADVATVAQGTVADSTFGFTSDELGTFYALNVTVGNEELFVSAGDQAGFTALVTLSDDLQTAGIRTMGFAPFDSTLGTGDQALYLVGQDGRLYEINWRVGSGTEGDIINNGGAGAAIVDSDGDTVDITSMAFNLFGTFNQTDNMALGVDSGLGRLVDIDLSTVDTAQVLVGGNIATANGSMRPSVGGIAYDVLNDRFLAADNAPGLPVVGTGVEAGAIESAALMVLRGITGTMTAAQISTVDPAQDIANVMVGGRITGIVDVSGSMNQFYAGALLTGWTSGQLFLAGIALPGNFNVGGDLHTLVSGTSFGTHETVESETPTYMSGVDVTVGGQLGSVWSIDSWIGAVNALNLDTVAGFDSIYTETEGRDIWADVNFSIEYAWLSGQLYDGSERFYNDTFDTAQRLGTLRNPVENGAAYSQVVGGLDAIIAGDAIDFYGMSLLAGQTIEVQLTSDFGIFGLGVFDPDGRLVATNYNAVSKSLVLFDPFRFTADRPGEYRFAVAGYGDTGFTGDGLPFGGYLLTINDLETMSLGGVRVDQNILMIPDIQDFGSQNGDVGVISAGGWIWSVPGFLPAIKDVFADGGNFYGLVAGGEIGSGVILYDPSIAATGHVGLIHAGTDLYITTGFTGTSYIGGNLQSVNAVGQLGGTMFADAGIGSIRAGSLDAIVGAQISANTDNIGADGIIDLIDVTGDLGNIVTGGPVITTGDGGDVRYMRVGGTIYQATQFLVGTYLPIVLAEGETFTHTDDGGGRIVLTPGGLPNPAFDSTRPEGPGNLRYLEQAALTIRQFTISGSGGSVLVDVVASDYGINVSTDNVPTDHAVSIGNITIEGEAGQAVVTNERTGELELDIATDPLIVDFFGSQQVDILDIVGGQFTTISNQTGGELVSVTATSIGNLVSDGRIGVPRNTTGMGVMPIGVITDVYPFDSQRTGIVVSGDVVSVRADEGLGNLIIEGTVGSINANADRRNTTGGFEGVMAPIYTGVDLMSIDIGEGIAPSGSGSMSRAGLYSVGRINQVTNQDGGNIWGDVISNTGIDSIRLTNGSLINTQIATFGALSEAAAPSFAGTLVDLETVDEDGNRIDDVEIGQIQLTGDGGIIGSYIAGGDMGSITVSQGYGIVSTTFQNIGDSTIDAISADGFGILGVTIQAAQSLGSLTATGRGQWLSLADYSDDVLNADKGLFYDPVHNTRVNVLSDLSFVFDANDYRGTTDLAPAGLDGIAGQINDTSAAGVVSLGSVSAQRIIAAGFNFANEIGSITTNASADNDPMSVRELNVLTGYLGRFHHGSDVSHLNLTVAGEISSINIKGNLLGTSVIRATGPHGNIGSVNVTGNMIGSLFADGTIGRVKIGGDLTGTITAQGQFVPRGTTLGGLSVGGHFIGSLSVVHGDAGVVDIGGSLGNTVLNGDQFYIGGDLRSLKVGDARSAVINYLAADVIVLGDVGDITVVGRVGGSVAADTDGDIFVGGDFKSFRVTAHALNVGGDLVAGDVTVGGELGRVDLRDGDLGDGVTAWAMTVAGEIKSVQITNGDLAANYTVESLFENISRFGIRTGDLLGTVQALNGEVSRLDVLGSDMGANAQINAASAGRLRFDGSILGGGAGGLNITGEVQSLQVGVNIDAGATLNITSLQQLNVSGNMAAVLALGYTSGGTRIRIDGNWDVAAGTVIDADASIDVGGNLLSTAGAPLYLSRNAKWVRVDGAGTTDVVIDGAADDLRFGSLTGVVVTSGFDIRRFTVDNAIANSLIQAGISAGDNGAFAAVAGDKDDNEASRLAVIESFSSGTIDDSIIAAGGSIRRFMSDTLTNSSVSAGLVVGSNAIAAVQLDGSPLATAGERNAARSGADLIVYHGDIDNARVGGLGLVASVFSAGTDAGGVGDFAGATVTNSVTGGDSTISTISGTNGGGSALITDTTIRRNTTGIAETLVDPAGFLATIAGANPLETLQGSITNGQSVTVNGLTFSLRGNGQLDVRDDAAVLGAVDSIVLTGTDSRTTITVTGGGQIGRVLADDDATVGTFTYDGDIVGDGDATTQDIWINGDVRTFEFVDLGANVTGQIGGEVASLTLGDQSGSAQLRVGGNVRSLTIASGTGSSLQNMLGAYAGLTYNAMAFDAAGNLWAHEGGGVLRRVDPTVNNGVLQTVNVTDPYTGLAVDILGLDFQETPTTLYAAARLYDPQVTEAIGAITGAGGELRGLAVSEAGVVYAVWTDAGVDKLVTLDTTAGTMTEVGILRNPIGNTNYTRNVLALTFDNDGRLLAVLDDPDGNGGDAAAATLVEIATTALAGFVQVHQVGSLANKGVALSVNGTYTGLAMDPNDATDTLYAVRDNAGVDELYTINVTTGVATYVGDIKLGGVDTTISGIGFDADGNLLVMDTDGGDNRLHFLANADLATPANLQELTPGTTTIMDAGIDVFATARSGDYFRSYAYDTTGANGVLYANPIDATDAAGRVTVIGTIDLVTQQFERISTVSDPTDGSPLLVPAGASVPLAVDNTADDLYLIIPSAGTTTQLVQFDFDAANPAYTIAGAVLDQLNREVAVSGIDFDGANDLIGTDLVNGRVLEINPATAAAAGQTDFGVLSPFLTALTFNPTDTLFYSFEDGATDQFVQLRGTDQASSGGITVESVDRLDINGAYNARVVSTGNTFTSVNADGDFNGSLVTAGDIRSYTHRTGDFGGVLDAGGNIGSAAFGGNVLAQGRLTADGEIQRLSQNDAAGTFAGDLTAAVLGNLSFRGNVLADALFTATSILDSLTVGGLFAGEGVFNEVSRSIRISGLFDAGATMTVTGNARDVRLDGGTAATSTLTVGRNLDRLTVGNNHAGTLATGIDLERARFDRVVDGRVYVGGNGRDLRVDQADGAGFIYGVSLGADGLFNTADDVINGGSLAKATFGQFTDSVLTAGILPDADSGVNAFDDHQNFQRVVSGDGTVVTNGVEAGGLRRSTIDNLTITLVVHSDPSDPTIQPIVTTADGVESSSLRGFGFLLSEQQLGDAFGAVGVVSAQRINENQIQIIFTEPVNTDSLVLSEELGDGGSVIVTDDLAGTTYTTGITMVYTEQVSSEGQLQGVLTITRNVPFDGDVVVRLTNAGDAPIVDRSGLRSLLRNVGSPVDPLGTIFDGDGFNGENSDLLLYTIPSDEDVADHFIYDLVQPTPIPLDDSVGLPVNVPSTLSAEEFGSDIDVFTFNADQGEFLSVDYNGDALVRLAVFELDDQGTLTTFDDTYELMGVYESNITTISNDGAITGDLSLIEAFEIPATGTYYAVVTPIETLGFNMDYVLRFTLSDTAANLATQMGGSITAEGKPRINLGEGNLQRIAYATNPVKQLVYLNFEGGTSTETYLGNVPVDVFDVADLDASLAGQTDTLINGNAEVTGILDNIYSILDISSYLPNLPGAGGLNLQVEGVGGLSDTDVIDNYLLATEGLFFTTYDPSQAPYGLDADDDFTTIFTGPTTGTSGLYGLASNIDVGGQELGDEAIVFTSAMVGVSSADTVNGLLNEYSRQIANIIVHEGMHTFGFNHQPTTFLDYLLVGDDPNNDGDATDSNVGSYGIMAYAPDSVTLAELGQLGTTGLATNEFPIGDNDTATLLIRWFS